MKRDKKGMVIPLVFQEKANMCHLNQDCLYGRTGWNIKLEKGGHVYMGQPDVRDDLPFCGGWGGCLYCGGRMTQNSRENYSSL